MVVCPRGMFCSGLIVLLTEEVEGVLGLLRLNHKALSGTAGAR